MMNLRTLGVAATALCAANAFSQIAPAAGGAYDFKLKYTKGQKIVYTSSTSLSQGGMKPFDMTMTMTCIDVQKGVFTVKMAMSGLPGQKTTDATIKMDNKGKIVGGDATAKQAMGMGATNLPSGPIKPGQTWKSTVDAPVGGATMKVTTTYTFNGIKSVGGKQVADMKVSLSSSGAMSMTGGGTLQLSTADASLVNMVMNMKMSMQGQKFDIKTTMKRK